MLTDTGVDRKANRKVNRKTERANESEEGVKWNRERIEDNKQAKRNKQGSKDRGVGIWTWTGIIRKKKGEE